MLKRPREQERAAPQLETILERLGCLTEEGLAKLRKGQAPTITGGLYAGDIASVGHIVADVIPRAAREHC